MAAAPTDSQTHACTSLQSLYKHTHTDLYRHVSFIQHFFEICGPHKNQISGRNIYIQKYGTKLLETNYNISQGSGHIDSAILLKTRWSRQWNLTEMDNRNTDNNKIAVKIANLCRKNMRHAHFAEICEKCGNMQNMWQSHIRIKLTCLSLQFPHTYNEINQKKLKTWTEK